MPFYIRKGVNLGPLRINLSKRGLGASIGGKGMRAGVDAKGRAYSHAGRGGLYYRQSKGGFNWLWVVMLIGGLALWYAQDTGLLDQWLKEQAVLHNTQ